MPTSMAMDKLKEIAKSSLSPEAKKEQYRILAMNQAPGLSPSVYGERNWAVLAMSDFQTDPEVTRIFLEAAFQQSHLVHSDRPQKLDIHKDKIVEGLRSAYTYFLGRIGDGLSRKDEDGDDRTWREMIKELTENNDHEFNEPIIGSVASACSNKASTKTEEIVDFTWFTGKEYGEAFFAGRVKGHHTFDDGKRGVRVSLGDMSNTKKFKTILGHFQTPAIFTGKAPREILQPSLSGSTFLPATSSHLVTEVVQKTFSVGFPDPTNYAQIASSPLFRERWDNKYTTQGTDICIMITQSHALFNYEIRDFIPPISNKQVFHTNTGFDYEASCQKYTSDPDMQKEIARFMKKMIHIADPRERGRSFADYSLTSTFHSQGLTIYRYKRQ